MQSLFGEDHYLSTVPPWNEHLNLHGPFALWNTIMERTKKRRISVCIVLETPLFTPGLLPSAVRHGTYDSNDCKLMLLDYQAQFPYACVFLDPRMKVNANKMNKCHFPVNTVNTNQSKQNTRQMVYIFLLNA